MNSNKYLEKKKKVTNKPDISLNSHFSTRTVQKCDLSEEKKGFPFLEM